MPETYFAFVSGYLAIWLILFGFVAFTIVKISKLEKNILNSNDKMHS